MFGYVMGIEQMKIGVIGMSKFSYNYDGIKLYMCYNLCDR